MVRAGPRFDDAAYATPSTSHRSTDRNGSLGIRLVARDYGNASAGIWKQLDSRVGRIDDLVRLLLGLHSDEDVVVVEHRRRNVARRPTCHDRMDRCRRWPLGYQWLGLNRGRDPLAIPSLHGDCVAVSRPIHPSRIPNADARRANRYRGSLACDRSFGLLDPTFDGSALPRFASRLGNRVPRCIERLFATTLLDTFFARTQQRYGEKTTSRLVGLSSSHHDSRGHSLGMPVSVPALTIDRVTHHYGNAVALSELSFDVPANQIFGLLGPNGSGKSTLFRLISTLVPVQSGSIQLLGMDVMTERNRVRESLGVVFQSPSLDRKLTVRENMECQAALYGISGQKQADRIEVLAKLMGISDRLNERCERLSGGLKRRAELAKGLLHQPRALILDEPSTGLDPSARLDLWRALVELRDHWGTSVLLTTHLLEEADKCDCLAILDSGKLVALDSPDNLRRATGETVISVMTDEPELVAGVLKSRFGWDPKTSDHQVRVVIDDPGIAISDIMQTLAGNSLSITIGRPGLEDVFIRRTGVPFSSYQSDGRSIERK